MFARVEVGARPLDVHDLEGLAQTQFVAWMRRPAAALLHAASARRDLGLEPATPCWCRTVLHGARAGWRWTDTPRADRPEFESIVPDVPEQCEWLLGFQVATCWEAVRLGLLATPSAAAAVVEPALRRELDTTIEVLDAMDGELGLRPSESTVASALLFAHTATIWRRRCALVSRAGERDAVLARVDAVAAVLLDAVADTDRGTLDASIQLLAYECDDEHLHPVGLGQIFE